MDHFLSTSASHGSVWDRGWYRDWLSGVEDDNRNIKSSDKDLKRKRSSNRIRNTNRSSFWLKTRPHCLDIWMETIVVRQNNVNCIMINFLYKLLKRLSPLFVMLMLYLHAFGGSDYMISLLVCLAFLYTWYIPLSLTTTTRLLIPQSPSNRMSSVVLLFFVENSHDSCNQNITYEYQSNQFDVV